MSIRMAALPEGTTVRVIQGQFPQDSALLGRHGRVVVASDYETQTLGVVLEGESAPRFFARNELEVIEESLLPPEREAAKKRPALP